MSTLRGAVITISDSRSEETDTSGKLLTSLMAESGHEVLFRKIVKDDIYHIRLAISECIADEKINFVVTTGGTGVTGRDVTPEAVRPLFDKEIDGFSELFRWISYQEIGTSTIQSRSLAGISNGTFIFCLPGSSSACRTGWTQIISKQLDLHTKPCNFAQLLSRLRESSGQPSTS